MVEENLSIFYEESAISKKTAAGIFKIGWTCLL